MADRWFYLDTGRGESAFNMGLDEALLEGAESFGRPILRFYGWTEPAATFGYFQRYREVAEWTSLRPLIRRPTGGGLVPHDSDWTYTVVVPPGHAWYRLRAIQSYQRLHQWLSDAFGNVQIDTFLAPEADKTKPGHCFAGPEQFDLMCGSSKIAGAAQRRSRQGLLIQGSVQPIPRGVSRKAWQEAMLDTARHCGVGWDHLEPDQPVLGRAHLLAGSKYSREEFNQRR